MTTEIETIAPSVKKISTLSINMQFKIKTRKKNNYKSMRNIKKKLTIENDTNQKNNLKQFSKDISFNLDNKNNTQTTNYRMLKTSAKRKDQTD